MVLKGEKLAHTQLLGLGLNLKSNGAYLASNIRWFGLFCRKISGALALMSAMNQHNWAYEICTDGIAPIDKTRKVKTIVLTTWVFNQLWDLIIKDGIETSVELKFSSDTYSLKA